MLFLNLQYKRDLSLSFKLFLYDRSIYSIFFGHVDLIGLSGFEKFEQNRVT